MADIDKIKVGSTTYNVKDSTAYHSGDSAETTVADDDSSPFYDMSATATKKITFANLWTWIKSKLGIASSGSTYLKKDGTWGTPTNTTYTIATGDTNGQVKVTPSSGSAYNVDVKGLSDLAYISKGSGSTKFLREDGTFRLSHLKKGSEYNVSTIYENAASDAVYSSTSI